MLQRIWIAPNQSSFHIWIEVENWWKCLPHLIIAIIIIVIVVSVIVVIYYGFTIVVSFLLFTYISRSQGMIEMAANYGMWPKIKRKKQPALFSVFPYFVVFIWNDKSNDSHAAYNIFMVNYKTSIHTKLSNKIQ